MRIVDESPDSVVRGSAGRFLAEVVVGRSIGFFGCLLSDFRDGSSSSDFFSAGVLTGSCPLLLSFSPNFFKTPAYILGFLCGFWPSFVGHPIRIVPF